MAPLRQRTSKRPIRTNSLCEILSKTFSSMLTWINSAITSTAIRQSQGTTAHLFQGHRKRKTLAQEVLNFGDERKTLQCERLRGRSLRFVFHGGWFSAPARAIEENPFVGWLSSPGPGR